MSRRSATFEYAYPLVGAQAFMPPQGLLVVAAVLPASWSVRFVDENLVEATAADFAWAEVVFVSGMHIQRRKIDDIRSARACGRAHDGPGWPVGFRLPGLLSGCSITFMWAKSETPRMR